MQLNIFYDFMYNGYCWRYGEISPALIYRRFIFETRSVGGCWLSLPIMRIFGVHMRLPSPGFNYLIKKLILLKLETKTYSTT